MKNPLRTPEDYELYIYSIQQEYPSIELSSLTFVRRGAFLAKVSGEIFFKNGYRLVVRERLTFDRLPMHIEGLDMKSGVAMKSSIGMIRSRIRMSRLYNRLFRITNIFHRI